MLSLSGVARGALALQRRRYSPNEAGSNLSQQSEQPSPASAFAKATVLLHIPSLREPIVLPNITTAPQFYWFKERTEMQCWALKTLTGLYGSTRFL